MSYLEQGQKAPEGVAKKFIRKGKFLLAERLDGRLATGPARALLSELDERIAHTDDPLERKARQLIRENTLTFGNSVALRPSAFHRDTFMRDAFLIRQFADSPILDQVILDMFADVQDSQTGYIPTNRFAFGRGGFTFADESTFYYPILAFQAYAQYNIENRRHRIVARRALQYIKAQVDRGTGFIFNEGQTRTYWADELILPPQDVVTYKLGLAALALRVSFFFDIEDADDYAKRVEEGYRRLAQEHGGRLPLSLATG